MGHMDETPDPLAALAAEIDSGAHVYADQDTVVEAYHALLWAAATFGEQVKAELVKVIHGQFPRLAEIDAAPEGAAFAEVHSRYFEQPEDMATTVDVMADALILGQRWLWRYLKAHGHTQLRIVVPCVLQPTVRLWAFGSKSEILNQNGEPVRVVATIPEEDV